MTEIEIETENETTKVLGSLLHHGWGNQVYRVEGQKTWTVGLIDMASEREIMSEIVSDDYSVLPEPGYWVVWVAQDEREQAARYDVLSQAEACYRDKVREARA